MTFVFVAMYLVRIIIIDILYSLLTSFLIVDDLEIDKDDIFDDYQIIIMTLYVMDFLICVIILILFFIYARKA